MCVAGSLLAHGRHFFLIPFLGLLAACLFDEDVWARYADADSLSQSFVQESSILDVKASVTDTLPSEMRFESSHEQANGSSAEAGQNRPQKNDKMAAPHPSVMEHLLIRPQPEAKLSSSRMSIMLCYPSIGRKDVDSDIRQWIVDIADAFERHFDYDSLRLEQGSEELLSPIELQAMYSVSYPSAKAISITFELWNHTGPAQTNIDVLTLNYSLINGQRLELSDIFGNPEEALRLMSKWCRSFLDARYGLGRRQMMLAGTEPSIENFSSLTLTPSGICINFQPYQVAAGEMGVQRVEMPLTELAAAKPLTLFWEQQTSVAHP